LTVGNVYFDNRIDSRDLVALRNAYGAIPGQRRWNELADLNSDNIINLADLTLLLSPGIWGQYGDL